MKSNIKLELLNELEKLESSLFVNYRQVYNKYQKDFINLWKIAIDLSITELKIAITCLFILSYRDTK